MKVLLAFLLLVSPCFGERWTGLISSELALSTMSESVERVPRSKCTVCKGTGKVKAGDGVTIVWRTCDNCYEDEMGDEPVEDEADEADLQLFYFTASWCPPCQRVKQHEVPDLIESGWTVSEAEDAQMRVVDIDRHPELAREFNARKIPTFVLISAGIEVARLVGFRSSEQLQEFWDANQPGIDQ